MIRALALTALCCGCSPARLDSFLYAPAKAPPEGYMLSTAIIPRLEPLTVSTPDGETLTAVYVPSSGAHPDQTLIYCYGQHENIGSAWDRIELLYPLGYNIEIFDYRGFGGSTGSPSEPGIQTDALAARAELIRRTQVEPQKLIYYGRSLGAAVCIDLALHEPPGVLITESAFTSVQALVSDGAYADVPVGALAQSRWDSLAKIPSVPSPYLALHGTQDDYIRYSYSEQLVAAHPGRTQLLPSPGASHDDVPERLGGEAYRAAIAEFVAGSAR